jgi:hypothetical protein
MTMSTILFGCLVDFGIAGEARLVDHLVEVGIDVVGGVEHRIIAAVEGPEEEVVGVVEPAVEFGDDHRHRLLAIWANQFEPGTFLIVSSTPIVSAPPDQDGGRFAHSGSH